MVQASRWMPDSWGGRTHPVHALFVHAEYTFLLPEGSQHQVSTAGHLKGLICSAWHMLLYENILSKKKKLSLFWILVEFLF